ncbi:msp domain protein [Lasius niger]|uniref:Msp domain protein n=1 Tax=Lasius niger TaxID=67767 RepID=A0A0J7JXC4_LASNI|nr:msp domain protein [Lasius niger]
MGPVMPWKYRIEMLLIKEDLWDVVIGAPPSAATEFAAWTKRDGKARAIMGLMVEDAQLVHIKTKKQKILGKL